MLTKLFTETTSTIDENNKDIEKSKSNENINKENNENDDSQEKKDSKVTKRRSSLESGGEGGTGDGNYLRRHKSLDGGDQNNLQKTENEEKEKDKKDPRLERRIRNKVYFYCYHRITKISISRIFLIKKEMLTGSSCHGNLSPRNGKI